MANANREDRAVACSPDLPSVGRLWNRLLLDVARTLQVGQLRLLLPNGALHRIEGALAGPQATLVLRNVRPLRKLFSGGTVGFAEAFIDGDWDTPDLPALLTLAHTNERAMDSNIECVFGSRWLNRVRHLLRANTRGGSRRNIAYHYDLGNAFYAPWLDPSMTYSSALFDSPGQSLEDAQLNKYRRLAGTLDLRPGHHVLEIGCGWGAFAMMAAREFGCSVTALTLSHEQQDFARQKIWEAGLAERIDVRLQDYRDVDGTFDRIASVEMFEAVGEKYWPHYFGAVRNRLKSDGLAAIQVITIDDGRFAKYRCAADFIQTYIFPGGMLPSPNVLARQVEAAGLKVSDWFTFGESYAETLARWRRTFDDAWLAIASLGFDERFRRMWTFYLSYCEVGFRTGTTDVAQIQIRHA